MHVEAIKTGSGIKSYSKLVNKNFYLAWASIMLVVSWNLAMTMIILYSILKHRNRHKFACLRTEKRITVFIMLPRR